MPRTTTKKEQPWHYDPVVWGLGGAYLIGMLMAGTIQVMTSAPTLRASVPVRYNQSHAAYDADAAASDFAAAPTNTARGSGEDSVKPADTQNLLVNGSFELPIIRSESGVVNSSNPQLGWRVSWAGSSNPRVMRYMRQPGLELLAGYQGWQAAEGAQFARLDTASVGARSVTTQSLVSISQDVKAPAGAYVLSFDFAAQPKTSSIDNQLEILWNGHSLASLSADGSTDARPVWQHYSYTVDSTGKGDTVSAVGKGAENGKGVLVDNFSLVPAR